MKVLAERKHESKTNIAQSIPVISLGDRNRSNRVWSNYLPITFDWQTRLFSFMIMCAPVRSSVFYLALRHWGSIKEPRDKWLCIVWKMSLYHNNFSPQQLRGGEFRHLTSLLNITECMFPKLMICFTLKKKRWPSQCIPLFWHVWHALFSVFVYTE